MPYAKSKLNELRELLESLLVEGSDPEVQPMVPVYAGPRYLSDQGDSPKVVLTYSTTEFDLPTDNDGSVFRRVDLIWVYVFGRDVLNVDYSAQDYTATDETEELVSRVLSLLDSVGLFQVDGNRLIEDGEWISHSSDITDSWGNRGDVFRFSMRVADRVRKTTEKTTIDSVRIDTKLWETDGNTILVPPPSPPFAP